LSLKNLILLTKYEDVLFAQNRGIRFELKIVD